MLFVLIGNPRCCHGRTNLTCYLTEEMVQNVFQWETNKPFERKLSWNVPWIVLYKVLFLCVPVLEIQDGVCNMTVLIQERDYGKMKKKKKKNNF